MKSPQCGDFPDERPKRERRAGRGARRPFRPAAHAWVRAFSETDFTQDLAAFDVPTLILHGDDDRIVPIALSALKSSKMIKNAQLKVYQGAPHGMCSTLKDDINADLLAFIKGKTVSAATSDVRRATG